MYTVYVIVLLVSDKLYCCVAITFKPGSGQQPPKQAPFFPAVLKKCTRVYVCVCISNECSLVCWCTIKGSRK